jgi:hypothetical protein
MKGETILTLGGAALVALACGTTRLNAGSNGDGGTADAAPQGYVWRGTPSNSFELKCDLPAPAWLAGVWQGEFDSYTLDSGSKAVRIEFTGSFELPNSVCGTVTFGEGVPPPVAADPKAPPPGGTGTPSAPIIEGFAYEFYAGSYPLDAGAATPVGIDDQRVRFGITLMQIYKSWCNLQVSYAQFDQPELGSTVPPINRFRCVPPNAITLGWTGRHCGDSGLNIEWDSCAQALYCHIDVCDCGGWGCTVSPSSQGVAFDLSRAGTILSGNIALNGIEGLHLTRSTDGGS